MTDLMDAQNTMTAEEKPPLTVAYLIESLSKFPQDSEMVAALHGIALTIPIVGAMVVAAENGKEVTVLTISPEGAYKAFQHHKEVIEKKTGAMEVKEGEVVD